MNTRAAFFLLLAAVPMPAAPASAQEGGSAPRDISITELDGPGAPARGRVRITGKYKSLITDELTIHGSDTPFLVRRPDLARQLLDFSQHKDNISLTGRIVQGENGERTFEVEELTKGPSDFDLFSAEARLILQRAEDKAGALLGLARRIVVFHKEYPSPELVPLAHRIVMEAYQVQDQALKSEDAAGRLSFLRRIRDEMADDDLTARFLLELGSRYPGHEGIRAFLLELGCRTYRGRWVTREEYKRLEGLVLSGEKWVTPGEKHLQDSLEAFLRSKPNLLLLRKRTEREYRRMTDNGEVEPGMTREEVEKAIGFPDRVRRRAAQGKDFDQWCYGEKHFYFFDGLLVATSG